MNNERKTELLVGIFLLVGLLLLGVIIMQFGTVRDLFKGSYHLRVSFPDAAGIKDGSPVVLGGARIGKVRSTPTLNSTFTGVVIDLEIFEGVQIPTDATFQISSAGLMGDALIDIKPTGKITDDFLPVDHNLLIEGKASALGDIGQTATQVAEKVEVVLDDMKIALKDVKEAMAKINKDTLSESTIADFKSSMEHLSGTMKRLDEKVLGDENADNLKAAIADVKEGAAGFKASGKNVEEATKKLGPMLDKLDPAIAKIDKVIATADEALKAIKSGADGFASFTRKLNTSDGLLQALMSDPALKDDFKDLISNMRRRGVVFYRDDAAKQDAADEAKRRQPTPLGRPGR